jgi:hypothetical protein
MHGFIALYLIACLDPTNHNTCVSLPVTDSTQAQPNGSETSMMDIKRFPELVPENWQRSPGTNLIKQHRLRP